MDYRKIVKIFLVQVLLVLVVSSLLVIYVDPFFHYRKPNVNLFYKLDAGKERYQNDGIIKHFIYDTMIIGTSMTENFKASECDYIFHANTIKVPFSGGTYKEINDNIATAYRTKHQLKNVIRSLDWSLHLVEDRNTMRNDLGAYPWYLYNDKLNDDIAYFINKDAIKISTKIIKETLLKNRKGITGFDEYANWNADYKFGEKAVLKGRAAYYVSNKIRSFNSADEEILKGNIEQNVISLARQHPETTFYYFFPPYSIAYWGELKEKGELEYTFNAEKMAIEMILTCPNIKLYSFNLKTDVTTNLDNYKDATHYGEWINSDILKWMKNEDGLLTKENYLTYLQAERDFYSQFDYDSLLKYK
ncbi:hypothetical protein [uncultured Phascolarctobacterium sp.]|uniref:hypothetical protein n=1 Tax=uncultured Phascolarctobacterium sp. TaxID=512296 RepID=UPI0025FD3BBB|nr:hypothetical protein [uncultured Phascolarctobacterium sp.]